MKRKIVLSAAFCLYAAVSSAQKTQEVDLVITHQIISTEDTKKLEFLMLIPNDIEYRQTVSLLEFSVEPDSIFQLGTNKYAKFELQAPLPASLICKTNLTIVNGDYSTVSRQKAPPTPITDTARYLLPEPFIESDHALIISKATELAGKTPAATVKKIFNFVKNYFPYSGYFPQPQGALYALKNRQGDCTEYSYLMIALCRACGIPARSVYGITANSTNTPKHDWVEVYIEGIGWVSYDPTPGHNQTFKRMENKYVFFCPDGKDPIMENSHFYRYRYGGNPPIIKEYYSIRKK